VGGDIVDAGLSLHMCPFVLQVATDMSAMFALHGITKASMLAHSYGTFYVSCLLKLLPEKVCRQICTQIMNTRIWYQTV